MPKDDEARMDANDRHNLITAQELSAILAHEIKNPMNSIIINVEVLKCTVSESVIKSDVVDRVRKSLDAIETEVQRLDRVIKGFLEFANPSPSSKINFKLGPVLSEISRVIETELQAKHIQLLLDINNDSPCIFGNPDQIKQAVLNLLVNASQSLPEGGTISVSLRCENNRAIVTVKDNGPGIPKEIQTKIFTPYFTTKAKGSGIGLSIVKRVIQEHDGAIQVESEPGKGAAFVLIFPVAESTKRDCK